VRARLTPIACRLAVLGLAVTLGCGDDAPVPDMAVESDGGAPEAWHVASTAVYSPSGELTIERPESAEGDLLVLFLSRTDDLLPLRLDDWSARVACLTSTNTQLECLTPADCTMMDGDYCLAFGDTGDGQDLATAVFTRSVGPGEPASYAWALQGIEPSWAVLTAVRGANAAAPVRDSAIRSFDAVSSSVFPSANAEVGDLLLLLQSFDDPTTEGDFLPPDGLSLFQFVGGTDEASYLFGGPITEAGPTGERETLGVGGPDAKDLMITLVVAAE
jgi:hypothetical protein